MIVQIPHSTLSEFETFVYDYSDPSNPVLVSEPPYRWMRLAHRRLDDMDICVITGDTDYFASQFEGRFDELTDYIPYSFEKVIDDAARNKYLKKANVVNSVYPTDVEAKILRETLAYGETPEFGSYNTFVESLEISSEPRIKSFEEKRNDKWEEIRRASEVAKKGALDTPYGFFVDFDEIDITLWLNGIIASILEAVQQGVVTLTEDELAYLDAGIVWSTVWPKVNAIPMQVRGFDDNMYDITLEEARNISSLQKQGLINLYKHKWVIQKAVTEASSEAELNAISWTMAI